MSEAAARALYGHHKQAQLGPLDYDDLGSWKKRELAKQVRIVIEAVQEPSLQMINAGYETADAHQEGFDVEAIWRAMVKSILEDEH